MRFIHNSSFDPFPFIKPGLALCSDELYSLKNVMYVLEGEYRNISELGMDSNVELKGDAVGTVKEFFEWMFLEFIIPQAQAYLKEHRMEIFKTYYDLTKTMYLEKEQEFEELFVIGDKSISTDISKVKFITEELAL